MHTLRQIDDNRMGVVKSAVFQNLLNCLDVEMSNAEMRRCQQIYGLQFEAIPYIRYEAVLKLMHYDNHAESWRFKLLKNDHLALNNPIAEDNISDTTTVLSAQVRRLQERCLGQRSRMAWQDANCTAPT